MTTTSKQKPGDGGKRPKRSRSLLPEEEADQRVNVYGEEVTLNKGPWIKEEDEILKAHIIKHGVGNWNAVQKESGLLRCGKSCRLRWYNHLRPGVKKGSFTAEEEHKILDFYFRNGSKWAQMTALLPGRTDNQIKNFWHTRSKKRQRLGLPIFPDEITSKYSLNGSQENADTLANEFSQHHETETFNVDITNLNLTHFKFRPDMLPQYFDSQYDKPNSDLVGRCSDMSDKTMPSAVVGQRYLFSSRSAAVPEVFDQYGQYPMLSTPCDPNLNTNLLHGYDNPVTGIHAASTISSEPINGSMRFESPSFQNLQTQQCSWSSLPSFESVDKFVQSPPIETCLSVRDSPDCSHLIERNLKGSSIDSLQANINSTVTDNAQHAAIVNCQIYLRKLPRRTDNEINSFWHTRSKKRQRAGLPIYPNEITSKYSFNGSQESAGTLANESCQHDETEAFNLDITDLDLKDDKLYPDMLPPFFDSQYYKPVSDLVGRCSDMSDNTLSMPSAVVGQRYLFSSRSDAVPEVFDQYGQYPMLSTPCDPNPNTNLHGYDNPITGFHAASNISSSEPTYGGSMSFELPSFQNSQTQQCTWSGMHVSPLPSFESVYGLVHAPPNEHCLSVSDFPDCSHLIDPIYYHSDQNLKGSSIDSLQANTDIMAPNEANISTQWNGLDYDQHTALTTRQINISRCVDTKFPTQNLKLTQDYDIYGGAFNDQFPAYSSFDKKDNMNQKGLALPNTVLDSGWH